MAKAEKMILPSHTSHLLFRIPFSAVLTCRFNVTRLLYKHRSVISNPVLSEYDSAVARISCTYAKENPADSWATRSRVAAEKKPPARFSRKFRRSG